MTDRDPPSSDALSIDFRWLLLLRALAVAIQAVAIAVVHFGLGVTLPLGALALLLFFQVGLNLASRAWMRRGGHVGVGLFAWVAAADIVAFTGVLYFTGGTSNPFGGLYLVYIALSAVVLPARLSFVLVGFALLCSALLFNHHVPLPNESAHHHEDLGWRLRGTWLAFGVVASLLVYSLSRVLRELQARERELDAARRETARQERLAALATLAAGAAHELASPLATIAVAATELEKQLSGKEGLSDALNDAMLIRGQVERCRAVLDQLATDAGQGSGAPARELDTGLLVRDACVGLDFGRIEVSVASGAESARLPRKPVEQALRSLLKNGLDASPSGKVAVRVARRDGKICFEVQDSGTGMSADVAERAGEPFFTTKGKRGMGLGVFLARSVAEQLGGSLELRSQPGQGTIARWVVAAPSSSPAGATKP